MTQPSSLATLIVVSLLSRRPCTDGISAKRSSEDGGLTLDNEKVLENMFRCATSALAVVFVMAANLPPSSLAFDLDFGASKSSDEMSQDVHEPLLFLEQLFDDWAPLIDLPSASSLSESNDSISAMSDACDTDEMASDDVLQVTEYPTVDSDDVKKSWMRRSPKSRIVHKDNEYPVVDSDDVKDMWMKRTRRSPRARKQNRSPARQHSSPIRLFQIQEEGYDSPPKIMPCDSLVSLSSSISGLSFNASLSSSISDLSCNSIRSRSSSDFLSFAATNKTRTMSLNRNAEWGIMQ